MFQIFSPGACWWGAAASTQLSVLRAEFLHPGLEVRPEPEACSPMWGQGDPQEGRAGVFQASVGSGTAFRGGPCPGAGLPQPRVPSRASLGLGADHPQQRETPATDVLEMTGIGSEKAPHPPD